MGDEDLKFPEWQAPLQVLILETDRQEVREEEIGKVEALIYERLEQISESHDGHIERVAIFDALSALRIFRRDVLRVRASPRS